MGATVGCVLGDLGDLDRQQLTRLVIDGCPDECDKQWVRPGGSALQLGVGLGADNERMPIRRILDELYRVRQVTSRKTSGRFRRSCLGTRC